jgi:hypothetical protein
MTSPSGLLPDSYGSAARERRAEAKLRACRILAATVFLAEAGNRTHDAKRVKRLTKRLLI